jgi:competence protein ComEC
MVVTACWLVQQLPQLPARPIAIAMLLAGLMLLWFGRFSLLIGTALSAFGWAALQANVALEQRLPESLDGTELVVIGVVEQMPQHFERGLRFRFLIERCVEPGQPCPGQVAVRASWYSGGLFGKGTQTVPQIEPGQRWQLSLRLKRPHASLNPGLFDAELRALQERVAAVAYVRKARPGYPNQLLQSGTPSPLHLVERLRMLLRDRMRAALSSLSPQTSGVLVALVIGDQTAISAPWWELFNRTGIGHLMSISGLHITMLAALAGGLAGRLWRSARLAAWMNPYPLPALVPAPQARWLVGVLAAFGYSLLAGWGIPAQRTCWMLAVAGVAVATGRARNASSVINAAAAVVCLMDPWAPMAAGFWLSFAAVSSIIWYASRSVARDARQIHAGARGLNPGDGEPSETRQQGRFAAIAGRWRYRLGSLLLEAVRTQFAATVVLLPLGVLFFASVSLVSPIANALAIPLVSALITPLAMAGAALTLVNEWGGGLILNLAGLLTDALLASLAWLDRGGGAALAVALPSPTVFLLATVSCACLLAPIPLRGKTVSAIGLLPLLFSPPVSVHPDELILTALDVGQGTAVLVETAGRRLLYDTGPPLGVDVDAGSRIIVPYLRARGIRHLDAMVVSHLDSDHSSGALSVLRNMRVDWVASSLPQSHPIVSASRQHHHCLRDEQWQWGATRFRWLHPDPEQLDARHGSTNARSCVLRIDNPGGAVLLVGDIEARQERAMLAREEPAQLRAKVLLAPHHGSKTSSTPEFLAAVDPAIAIFQIGFRNRYRHPHPTVLSRYRNLRVQILRSDQHAAIRVRMRKGVDPQVTLMRTQERRYWRIQVTADRESAQPAPDSRLAVEAIARSSRRRSSTPRRVPVERHRSTETTAVRRSAPV